MGLPSSPSSCHLVNVIDFGLAKKYKDPMTGDHIPYRQDDSHGVGTSLFAGINTHRGIGTLPYVLPSFSTHTIYPESSRRDDLESLAYMLIYFLRGTLPWRRIRSPSISTTWSLIFQKKLECEALLTVGLPEEFDLLYKYSRRLGFDDIPDYEGLRQLFRALGESKGVDYNAVPKFDWDTVNGKTGRVAGGTGHGGRYCEACNKRQR
jgi:casein kinase I homolog HRR25